MIYLTSDLHLGHENILKYCPRPYANVYEMNEALVRNWNAVVKPTDVVYCLGDVSMRWEPVPLFTPRLNGTKYLVAGNHDLCHPVNKKSSTPDKHREQLCNYRAAGWDDIEISSRLFVPDLGMIELHHMPYLNCEPGPHGDKYADYRPIDEGRWLLHGHTHGLWKVKGRMIDVGVDAWNYAPVSLDTIVKLIQDTEKERTENAKANV